MTLLQLLQTSEREQEQEKERENRTGERETEVTGLAVHRWWRRGQDSKAEEDGGAGQNRLKWTEHGCSEHTVDLIAFRRREYTV